MTPLKPTLHMEGPAAIHDMPCAILPGKSAVYAINYGIFVPSWEAQQQGWHTIKAETWFQRKVLKWLFGKYIR